MKKYLLKITAVFLFLTQLSIPCSSQLQWAYGMGVLSYANDKGQSIATDQSNNVYVSGMYNGGVDFDPGPGLAQIFGGNGDVFLAKYNANGQLIWAKDIGGLSINTNCVVTTDKMNNVLMIGDMVNVGDFGCSSLYGYGNFILKLDSSGNCLWNYSFPQSVYSISTDQDGNVFTIGAFESTMDLDPGPGIHNVTSPSGSSIYIMKLDANGNFKWVNTFKANFSAGPSSIATDTLGNVYATGTFDGTVDFDPGTSVNYLISLGTSSSYIIKYDSSGNYKWAKQFTGSAGSTSFPSIAVSPSGRITTVGNFIGSIDFNTGPLYYSLNAPSLQSIYFARLDSNGNFVWAKKVENGNPGPLLHLSTAIDENENVYTTGSFTGTADFDPGPLICNLSVVETITSVNADMFILKLDSMGNFNWVKHIGDNSSSIHFDESWDIAVDQQGGIYSTGTFTNNINLAIAGNPVQITSTGKIDIIVLKFGSCTSASIATDGSMLTSTNTGLATYQWLTCSPYAVIAGATNKDYTPSSSGSYALVLNQNGCVDTSACYSYIASGMIDQYANDQLQLFPNPCTKFVHLSSEQWMLNASLNIIDLSGKLMLEKKNLNGFSVDADISTLANGVYFVQINDNHVVKQFKFIKN